MPLGITGKQVSPQAFLNLETETIVFPVAADADKYSSATDGGTTAATDASAFTVGSTVFLSIEGKRPFRAGRLPTMTLTDAAGANLGCTFRLVGRRFGRIVTQDFTWAAGDTALLAGTKVIDEITSCTLVAISAGAFAASDTIQLGCDGTYIGLQKPIKSVKSVKLTEKLLSSAPSSGDNTTTAGIRFGSTVQTSDIVDVAGSAIKFTGTGMYSTLAATDIFIVQYMADGIEEFKPTGRKFG